MKQQINIKKFRKSLGLSQKELAKEIGTHQLTISRWEAGETPKTKSSAWHSFVKLFEAHQLEDVSK